MGKIEVILANPTQYAFKLHPAPNAGDAWHGLGSMVERAAQARGWWSFFIFAFFVPGVFFVSPISDLLHFLKNGRKRVKLNVFETYPL
jgi:hypothetical protein